MSENNEGEVINPEQSYFSKTLVLPEETPKSEIGIVGGPGELGPEDLEVFERLPSDGGIESVQQGLECGVRASRGTLWGGRVSVVDGSLCQLLGLL